MRPFTAHIAAFAVMTCLTWPASLSAGLKSGPTTERTETAAPGEQQQQPGAELQRVYQEGEKALAEGRYDDAARAYEELRKADPRPERIGRRNITLSPRDGTPVVLTARHPAGELLPA